MDDNTAKMCELFNVAKTGVQLFNAQIGESCSVEPVCRESCVIFDPSGKTSRAAAVEILQKRIWGRERLKRFYKQLENHVKKVGNQASVVVIQVEA